MRALFGGFHTGRLRRRRVFHLDRLHFGREKKETIKWLGVESAVQTKLNLDSCLRGLGGSGGRRGGGGGRRGGRRRGEAGGERGEVLEVEPELVLVESVKIVWVSLRLIYFRT